jgi:hypothetical protein
MNEELQITLQFVRLLLMMHDRLLHAAGVDLDRIDCRARAVDSIQQAFKAVRQRLAALQNYFLLGLQRIEGGKKKAPAVLQTEGKWGMTQLCGSPFPTNSIDDKNTLEIRSLLMAEHAS